MPMVALLASGSIASINGSGVSAGTPTRLMTTAYLTQAGNNRRNEGGFYGLYWRLCCIGSATAAASAQVPVFTWFDNSIASGTVTGAPVTATGGFYGGLMNGQVSAAIALASGATVYGLTANASAQIHGCEYFLAGSGASGASAYVQVSCAASNPVAANPARYQFDFRLFEVDDWGV